MLTQILLAPLARAWVFRLVVIVLLLHGACQGIEAQTTKLPAPDELVRNYVKAVGGRKKAASVRDAVFDWEVQADGEVAGKARTWTLAPGSTRTDLTLRNRATSASASLRSAWRRDAAGLVTTLTDAEAGAAKLRATLDPLRLHEYKKQNVLARTVGLEERPDGEAVYVVEFTWREGGRLLYSFGATSRLLLAAADDAARTVTRFGDYRAASEGGPLAAHRVEVEAAGDAGPLTLTLLAVQLNPGLTAPLFDPPGEQPLDVAALLREVERNQSDSAARLADYTYTLTDTKVEVNDRGEVKRRRVRVYEVYPTPDGGSAQKLVSEDGVPLGPERLERETRRVAAELEKAERRVRGAGARTTPPRAAPCRARTTGPAATARASTSARSCAPASLSAPAANSSAAARRSSSTSGPGGATSRGAFSSSSSRSRRE